MIARISAASVGTNKGRPRVWLEGRWLADVAGFEPGTPIRVTYHAGRVVVSLDLSGDRRVSRKGGRADVPVIDIHANGLSEALGQATKLEVRTSRSRIVICPSRTEALKAARTRNGLEGSVFSGGGLLSEAARRAGLKPAFGIEIDPEYCEVYERANPGSVAYNMSVHDVPWETILADDGHPDLRSVEGHEDRRRRSMTRV